ncbi:tubulin polyglutamylase ttll-4 isoform X2 [Episyrphus balteatus]|nr:tubulin polyglutamylase ttll-4 isoform X2 [Episyrphus balteatus]
MPSSDTRNTETSNRIRPFEERLKNSRTLFDLSRTKVEILQKRTKTKRVKTFEKPSDNSWITSGHIGSRDAVLVFRTSILNSKNDEYVSPNISDDQNVSTSNTSLDNCSSDSSSSLNITAKSTSSLDTSLVNTSSSKAKVLLSLPKNVKTISNSSSNSLANRKQPLGARQKEILKSSSPKKRLHDSLSSSETSISSECDDPLEVEEDIRLSRLATINSRPTIFVHNEDADGSNALQKSDSFDNKENEHDEDQPESGDLPAVKLNITYKFMNTETKLLKKIFVRHGLTEADGEQNFNILWTGVHMKPDILRNLTPYQRVNHFPRSYELTRKDRLYKNIEKMQHLRGFKHFDIVPQSFVLPIEYRDLVSAHNKYRGPWIVKPAASSRGRGIFIVNSPDQICADEQVLVSKYVADPLCIDGHKCDLRVYVLVTSFDPLLIYVYEEGLVRLATVKYDRNAENLWNPCMHLCNYSINKYHSDYIKSSDAQDEDVGHKWTLSALLRHLKSQGCDTRQLMSNIEDLIIKSIFATAQSIISACRMFVPNGNNCFELYGFDILIDDTLKPWLLEINLSPSMGVDSPIDTKVKAALITDLLTLVGIPAYSQLMRAHYDSTWSRFRNVSYGRRTNSADHLGVGKKSGSVQHKVPLTAEEQRIIRNVRLQNARRGGFVRIFPTEDSMQRYSAFLDPASGIPISTTFTQGQGMYSMIMPHNFNQMLFDHLYGRESKGTGCNEENSYDERMNQYERVLETATPISFGRKKTEPKCIEEGRRLRKQIRKLIENGSEFTQLQARQTFGLYLESILRRLTQEPRDYHEKLILKFISRVNGGIKAPVFFKNPFNYRVMSKDRSAMVAKLLGDYLEGYNRDTETYIDSFDNYGKIPIALFNDFTTHAQEADLESVLTLHTNLTQTMPFLYNRCGPSVPATPPIPTGAHGFLKALPSMIAGGSKEMNRIDIYYKNPSALPSPTQESTNSKAATTNDKRPNVSVSKKVTPLRR